MHKAVLEIEDKDTKVPEFIDMVDVLFPNVPSIMFNRSFLIIVKDETFNLPFFTGKVGDPRPQ